MQTKQPMVSVVIPTKDRLKLLKNALQSLERQKYPHWEALVVDDGSTDGTISWFTENNAFSGRIRLLISSKLGASACRNRGLSESGGEFILFLDSDDLLMPRCLEDRLASFFRSPLLDFVLGEASLFLETPGDTDITFGGGQRQHDLERMIALHYSWQTSAPLWRRSFLESIGGWDESLGVAQDVDLMSRALVQGPRYERLKKVDYHYRIHPGGLGSKTANSAHVPDHLRRLDTLIHLLEERGMLNSRIRHSLAGNYLWLAQNLMIEGKFQQSLSVWKLALDAGLASVPEHQLGKALLWCVRKHRMNLFIPFFIILMPRGSLIQPSLDPMNDEHTDRHGDYLPMHFPLRCRLFGTTTHFSFRKWVSYIAARVLRT